MSTLGVKASPYHRGRVMLVPDNQHESQNYPQQLFDQMTYIIAQAPDLVIFIGDDIETNTVLTEWVAFQTAVAMLTAAGIKWVIASGNHDYNETDPGARVTSMNTYLTAGPWITGLYQAGHVENSYTLVTLMNQPWGVLCLEYSPRDATLAWANTIVQSYPNTRWIVATHAYLYSDGIRYDWLVYGTAQDANPNQDIYQQTPAEGINDGQQIWLKLIQNNTNIRLVVCGHVIKPDSYNTQARRTDTRAGGTICHQVLQNYQEIPPNGTGWLRNYYFDEANGIILVNTYSPFVGNYSCNARDQFTLPMP
jgi:Calcineurin-like phosphoesterase